MIPAAQRVIDQAARALGAGRLSLAWWDPARALLVRGLTRSLEVLLRPQHIDVNWGQI